jgi:negative regulator of flagellin synthesis FlgM
MAIEINGQRNPLATNVNEGASKTEVQNNQNAKSPDDKGRGATFGDSVNLTDTASMLKKMEASLSTVPVIDSKRVESVKQSIMNGSFNIDPGRIAEKMLSYESLLKHT